MAQTETVQYKTAIRLEDGHVTVFELEKKGTKYLHGFVMHKGDQEEISKRDWTIKFDKSEYRFLDTARWDLYDLDRAFMTKMYAYRDQRQKAVREIEYDEHRKMYDIVNGRISNWDTENPEPTHPLLDSLPTVGEI